MTHLITTPDARIRTVVRLGDLDVAPENLRFGEGPDDDVLRLADSIRAAGVLLPLTVRAGRGRKERPWMALDGRRRLLALSTLRDAGEIDDDFPVEVYEETDPARQAATAVLTNTATPVHVADVIAAIGRMLTARLKPAAIAAALGQDEIEVKRLAALSALPPEALGALRQGGMSLRQARLLARLADRDLQVELSEQALKGGGFPEWRVTERLSGEAPTPGDRRCTLVDPGRYVAAGGRIEADLFGELPDRLLDPAILTLAWEARVSPIAARLEQPDLVVRVAADEAMSPEALEVFHESRGWNLTGDARETWLEAREAAREAEQAVAATSMASDEVNDALVALCLARMALDAVAEPRRRITQVILTPHKVFGLEVTCYGAPAEAIVDEANEADGDTAAEAPAPSPTNVVAFPPPEPDGTLAQSHADTEAATQGLGRALADAPDAALTAVVARLFVSVALRGRSDAEGGALAIRSEARRRADGRTIETLEGDVRDRLAERKAAFEESALSPIAWVASMDGEARLSLLALTVGLSLDLLDTRTGRMRPTARAEAAELASLSAADLRLYWTPDIPFLRVHTKCQLLSMLSAMQAEIGDAGELPKPELVDRVAAEAAARAWAPASLVWAEETAGTEVEPGDAAASEG